MRSLGCFVASSLLLSFLFATRALAADPGPMHRLGLDRFEQALSLARSDPPRAQSLFREAAVLWRTVAHDHGVRLSRLEANIGNAFALAQDDARAIASYRRALRLDPADRTAAAGLKAMLARAGISESDARASRLEQALLWIAVQQRRWLLWGFAACHALGWSIVAARLAGATWPTRRLAVTFVFVSVTLVAPIVVHDVVLDDRGEAVIVAPGTIARQGPSDGAYEPAFKEPLPAGLTVQVRERRGAWSRVALPDGRGAWLPEASLETISP
ncbi:MAG: hypothetical protein ACKVW3_11540 [Phycisphaerales bacterium]